MEEKFARVSAGELSLPICYIDWSSKGYGKPSEQPADVKLFM